MRSFTIDSSILPLRHYHVPYQQQINELRELQKKNVCFTVLLPPKTFKTTYLEELQRQAQEEEACLLLDFSIFTRTDFSTIEKFSETFAKMIIDQVRKIDDFLLKAIQNLVPQDLRSLKDYLDTLIQASQHPLHLLIDDVHEATKHDAFNIFLGLCLKKFSDHQKLLSNSFASIGVASCKKINQFHPFERGLFDPDFFETWRSEEIYSTHIAINEEVIANYLNEYARQINFTLEDGFIEEIIEQSQGKLLIINKLMKFIDEKVRIYKKNPVLSANEVKHAAGYVLVQGPY